MQLNFDVILKKHKIEKRIYLSVSKLNSCVLNISNPKTIILDFIKLFKSFLIKNIGVELCYLNLEKYLSTNKLYSNSELLELMSNIEFYNICIEIFRLYFLDLYDLINKFDEIINNISSDIEIQYINYLK